MHPASLQSLRSTIAAILLLLPTTILAQEAKPLKAIAHTPLIVIGFAGGFIKRTSVIHGEIELANHLRDKYGAAIHSEIFENHQSDQAYQEILHLLATQHGPTPTAITTADKQHARIILYGHSWGASEAVDMARRLQHDGIPVLLLIEVDGVRKHQHDDSIIPANVAQAINFYQTEGLLHGRPIITAADPNATQIIDNIHLTYKDNEVPTPGYPWFARTFTKRHIEIENDPRVWNQVEAMIQADLPPTN
jgi:hypothetical protein